MMMIKTFIKNVTTLGTIVLLWGLYAIGYLSVFEALNMLTLIVFVTVIALSAEDILDKVIRNRELITWQYAILMAFVVSCDMLWLFLAACGGWLELISRTLLLLAAICGTCAWAWFAYRVSTMTEEERELLIKETTFKKYARKFPKLSDEEVRKYLSKALFCKLEGDSLEGRLLVSEPFDDKYRTLDELLAEKDSGADISNISGYIETLITKRNAPKTTKEKKENV